MRRVSGAILVIIFITMLPGAAFCLSNISPRDNEVELEAGDAQTFEATSRFWFYELEWLLDGHRVAGGVGRYTYTAGKASAQEVHILEVRETFWHYTRDRMRWSIKVLPSGTGNEQVYYRDRDRDGYGDPDTRTTQRSRGYVSIAGDCDDRDHHIHPDAVDVRCDGIDQDCDGIDSCDSTGPTYYQDADGDGFGDPTVSATGQQAGYVLDHSDCDDNNAAVHPGASEIECDGVDQDCNGTDTCIIPDQTYYRDADGDGYGDPTHSVTGQQAGYVLDHTDCNDNNAVIHPGAVETCNEQDDNCNGATDEGVLLTFYRDADSDGYGATGRTIQACTAPAGYVADNTDCDDAGAAVHPGATEVECDGIDQDCSGGDTCSIAYYRDADGDGYGDPTHSVTGQQAGYVLDHTDCNDNNAAIHPGAAETCNEQDDNCNGSTDEGVQLTFYCDADHDGYGTTGRTIQACAAPSGYVSNQTDCNDADNAIRPGAAEVCNGIDDNCNSLVDDEEAGVVCNAIPVTPLDVKASDMSSGLTSIQVTWSASPRADYYNVYRAAWDEGGDYERVGDHVDGTSFTYTQDWQTDVLDPIGAYPMDDSDYLKALETYHDRALPYIFNFKAPAFFKVEACNDLGCSAMSTADGGQAEFIHTAEYSEVALALYPLWLYPLAKAMLSMPVSADVLNWCGLDVCGFGGGMVMSRVNTLSLTRIQLDIFYENYIDTWSARPEAQFWANGYFGGLQTLSMSTTSIAASGEFDVSQGAIDAHLFAYLSMALTADASDGYVTVTYKGASYQFTLSMDSFTGGSASFMPEPVVPPRNDANFVVPRQDTGYPVPFAESPPSTSCTLPSEDFIVDCDRIPQPRPVP